MIEDYITRQDVVDLAIKQCLNEMFVNSKPSITLAEYKEKCKNWTNEDIKPFQTHYLSTEDFEDLEESYIHAFNLDDQENLERNVESIKNFFEEPLEDVYEDSHRTYKKGVPLKEVIGEDAYNKVLEYLDKVTKFFNWTTYASSFRFNVCNVGPCSNEELVKDNCTKLGIKYPENEKEI